MASTFFSLRLSFWKHFACCPLRSLTRYCSLLHITGSSYFRYYCSLGWVPRERRSSVLVEMGCLHPHIEGEPVWSASQGTSLALWDLKLASTLSMHDHVRWFTWVETLPVLLLEEQRSTGHSYTVLRHFTSRLLFLRCFISVCYLFKLSWGLMRVIIFEDCVKTAPCSISSGQLLYFICSVQPGRCSLR